MARCSGEREVRKAGTLRHFTVRIPQIKPPQPWGPFLTVLAGSLDCYLSLEGMHALWGFYKASCEVSLELETSITLPSC